jgi:protein arginine kinase activator
MSETPVPGPDTCEDCGKAPATLQIKRVAAGEEVELRLCLPCAQARGIEPTEVGADPVSLLFKNLEEMEGGSGSCPGCGLTYSRFRETGRLGCASCYEAFDEELRPLLRRVHGDVKHIGKVPVRTGPVYEEAARLRRLNEDLERAIQAEEYERAAEIRDLIQQLETSSVGESPS